MRKRLRWLTGLTALILLAASAGVSAAPRGFSEDVTDFGRTPWRTHYTPTEPEYPLGKDMQAIWEVPLGLSRSQPLVVRRDFNGTGSLQTRIFHIAGDRLWALNGDMIPTPRREGQSAERYRAQLRSEGFILWDTPVEQLCEPEIGLMSADPELSAACTRVGSRREQRPFASSQAAYSPDQDVIYVGFGHPASLVALRATDGQMLGGFIVDAGNDRGIVGAPLVFSGDLVVIGTTGDYTRGIPADAFMIKGLASGQPSALKMDVGGRISSSPVPIGNTGFIIAADGHPDYGGYLAAHNLQFDSPYAFSSRWAPIRTDSGIPGEVAIDDQKVYFADKHGKMYALSIDTGEMLWCRQFPGLGTCEGEADTAPAFINNGPGVDEDKVYFVFRNNQGPDEGPGQVVALNKATFEPVWSQPMEFAGNTAPVPMSHIVIVGDTGGYVRAYDKETGEPVTFGGYPLRLSSEPYHSGDQGERWWEPISGTATQMTIAAELMLVGVNSQTEERTVLKAYKLHRLPDLTLRNLDLPATASTDGFSVAVRALCQGCDEPMTTVVSLTVNGMQLPRRAVTFSPDNNWSQTLSWPSSGPVPPGTVTVAATIDPDDLIDEADETNNTLRATVEILTFDLNGEEDEGLGSKLTD